MKKALFFALLFSIFETKAQTLQNFQNPPNSAKIRVWWHWMNGNISKDGIQKDLEWMHRVGIGGFQNFDASLMTPQIVDKRLTYMTPEWKDTFKFTTNLANQMGLEMAIAGSPGWSESGGPWVKPADGMKKIVWSEVQAKGGQTFAGKLPNPPTTTGKFQNLPLEAEFGSGTVPTVPEFYQDIAVIAYKIPESDVPLSVLNPVITSSGGNFTLTQLTDGDIKTTNLLPVNNEKDFAWIQYAFDKPTTIKAITIVGGGDKGPFGLLGEFKDNRQLEVSDDGINFRKICFLPAGNLVQQTIAIPVTKGKFFRVSIKNPLPSVNVFAAMSGGDAAPTPSKGTEMAEIVLHTATRINHFEEKAGFAISNFPNNDPTPVTTDAINQNEVVDLTNKFQADGTLNWTVPEGNWQILRLGYSLTGKENHPASPEATGLEVDKLNPTAITNYFNTYLDQYQEATGGLMGNKGGLQYVITDSWEAGVQNWTNNMSQEFEKRRGYSLLPWMPVLTGHVVNSAEASDKFLWDYRKTLSEMVAEYHYDGLTNLLAKRGMKRYSESHEDGRALIADGMEVKRTAAVPMSAMWTANVVNGYSQLKYTADIRESASVAHIYGQNLVAAESLTAFGIGGMAWSYSPENLKATADLELANGLNRFVIHTSVHQPVDDKVPGLGLGPFGQWFNRHETWAEQAKVWVDYLSRSSYLLQEGKFVADILYFYGEDNNITNLFGKKMPEIPKGYNYDFVNADALLHVISAKNGALVTPSGMNYKLLVLDDNAKHMSLSVLKKIQSLVKEGVKVTGAKPEFATGLKDNQAEFDAIVKEIWSKANVSTKPLSETLNALAIPEDFKTNSTNAEILFVHRKGSNGEEIYWLNNRKKEVLSLDGSFRCSGKVPALWNAQTGEVSKISYQIKEGRTIIPLTFEPNDAFFIIFSGIAKNKAETIAQKTEKAVLTLEKPWTVSFQEKRGAPATATFAQLQSWTDNSDKGIKYFSGTATYRTTFNAPKEKGTFALDLGEVQNIAEVFLNGKSQGIAWKTPFKVTLKDALKKGENVLEVKVTNLWVNRLIGDVQPDEKNKITYTTMPFYQAKSPLLPSGLMGPVKLVVKE